jgi:microsomal epoxide hydrolase
MRRIGSFALLLLLFPVSLLAAEGRVTTAPGIEIHYREAGPADAAHQMLLIPGWRISSGIWAGQMAYFSAHGYRIVAIDSRSQGGSTVVPQGNAPEDRAADIDAVIRTLKLKRVLLVGWSQGAQDVSAYVGRFGTAALSGVVLVDSPVSAGPEDVTLNPGFIKVIAGGMGIYARHPAEYTDGMMHSIISTPAPAQTFSDLDSAAALTPVDTGVSMLVQDLFAVDRRPDLAKFDKPTLVIASGQSPLLSNQQDMAKALPHGQFVAVDHAAHAVFFDQPQRFESLLEGFVAKLDASGS